MSTSARSSDQRDMGRGTARPFISVPWVITQFPFSVPAPLA